MNKRTDAEIKAYIDGYNDCFKQFCECFKGRKSLNDAIKKMELYRVAVNNVIEKGDES